MTDIEIYNDLPVVPALKTTWMLDGKLYKRYSSDKVGGVVTLINMHDKQLYTLLMSDFMKNRKHLYTIPRTADLLNRHQTWLRRQIWFGHFPPPTYYTPDGKFPEGNESSITTSPVYNEDQILELRDIMAERRMYSKDNVSFRNYTSIPSVQELRRRMGLDMLTYTKLPDGTFIPVWRETV